MLEFWPKMFKSIKYFKHHIKVYKNVKIAKQDIDQTDLLLSQSLAQSVSQPTAGCPIRRTFFSEIWLSEILNIKWRSPWNIDGHILLWGGSFWIFRFWHVWGLLDQINCFRESYNHCLLCPPQLLAR